MKSLTKKVWVEVRIDELENREEFSITMLSDWCPSGETCYTLCSGYGCPLDGLCVNDWGLCPELGDLCIPKGLCPDFKICIKCPII